MVNLHTVSVSRKQPHQLALLQQIDPAAARGCSHQYVFGLANLCLALPVQPAPDARALFRTHSKHELCDDIQLAGPALVYRPPRL